MSPPEVHPSIQSQLSYYDGLVLGLIGPVFLALAAWFWFSRNDVSVPHTGAVEVARADITTRPMRQPLPDPPFIISGGYRLSCMECHRLMTPPVQPHPRLMQHRHIQLGHGVNDQCFNCHDRLDRERLLLRTGETVPFADAPRLCGQCHGTTWRDWQRGVHGRSNGYWDRSRGTLRRLSCVNCHDPHAPAFDPMVPLPGPRTLRMGEPDVASHTEQVHRHNPLRQWSLKGHGDSTAEETP
ncbi:MAG: hypothetical protein ACYS0D_02180 [Planctomycetota bacterium]|jgi:hypothetical protein